MHLRLIGFAYGAVTATIVLVAVLVVTAHVGTPVEAHPEPVLVSAK
ncbi:MAG: hypothetical protein AB7V13_02180 [Pseudorhodoplanes sp.]